MRRSLAVVLLGAVSSTVLAIAALSCGGSGNKTGASTGVGSGGAHASTAATSSGGTGGQSGAGGADAGGMEAGPVFEGGVSIVEYAVPHADAGYSAAKIVLGSDGNMWFTVSPPFAIGRVTPGGTITEFQFLGGTTLDLVEGSDGAVWFVTTGGLGRMAIDGGVTLVPVDGGGPAVWAGMAVGPDMKFWIIDNGQPVGVDRVGVDGTLTSFVIADGGLGYFLKGIAPGPGGVWLVDDAFHVLRVDPSGQLTTFASPFDTSTALVATPDGRVWFLSISGIGYVDPDGGVVQPSSQTAGTAFTLGPDGNLWLAGTGAVARYTLAGEQTSFPTPSKAPNGSIVRGPGNTVWYVTADGHIGVITLH